EHACPKSYPVVRERAVEVAGRRESHDAAAEQAIGGSSAHRKEGAPARIDHAIARFPEVLEGVATDSVTAERGIGCSVRIEPGDEGPGDVGRARGAKERGGG